MRQQLKLMVRTLRITACKIAVLSFLCILGGELSLNAQSPVFSRQFKASGTEAIVIGHITTIDGGTLLVNDSRKVTNNDHYLDLIKSDSAGNVQWIKRFGPVLFGMKNVVQSPDGTYFLCYTSYTFGHYYEMIKLDANGTVLFDKRVDLPVSYRVGIYPMCIARNDGGYYVATTVYDSIAAITHWNLFSLDANGTLLWSNSYNTGTFTSDVTAIDTCDNGDVILEGQFYDLTSQKWSIIVSRINQSGAMLWTKDIYAVGIYDYYTREITHVGNNIILTAVAFNGVATESSTVLMKLDNNGNIVWSYRYWNTTRQLDPFDIVPAGNGDLAVTGTAFNPNIASYFMKVDSFGLLYSGRLYMNWVTRGVQNINGNQYSISGTYNDSIYPQAAYLTSDASGIGCADGSLLISRSPITFSIGNGSGFQSFPITIGTGSTPSVLPNYTGDDICRITGINSIDAKQQIGIFPSPASDVLTVTSSEIISEVELTDVNGKIVRRIFSQSKELTISVGDLDAGIYFMLISTARENVVRKIVIQH
jgi:hypothetical protein